MKCDEVIKKWQKIMEKLKKTEIIRMKMDDPCYVVLFSDASSSLELST